MTPPADDDPVGPLPSDEDPVGTPASAEDVAGGRDAGDVVPRHAFPEPFLRFVTLFNAGRFWDSHEALEDAWRETGSDFYHGLILYASAFVHAGRDNPHGIVAQLDKAERALRPYPSPYLGVDVEGLLAHADRCRRRVRERERERREALEEEEPGLAVPWSRTAPAPRLGLDPRDVRGDEPELRAESGG